MAASVVSVLRDIRERNDSHGTLCVFSFTLVVYKGQRRVQGVSDEENCLKYVVLRDRQHAARLQ